MRLERTTKPTTQIRKNNRSTLLLADTNSPSTATGSLGVLTTHTQTPVVTQTTVRADTLETLEVLTDLAVQAVGDNLRVLAVGDVALSVQEPCRDLVLRGGLEDGHDALEFFRGEFTGPFHHPLVSFFFFFSFFFYGIKS